MIMMTIMIESVKKTKRNGGYVINNNNTGQSDNMKPVSVCIVCSNDLPTGATF